MGFFEIASLQNVVDSENEMLILKVFKSDDDLQIRRDLDKAWLEFKPPQEELAESLKIKTMVSIIWGTQVKNGYNLCKNLAEGEKQVDFSFLTSSTQPPSTQSPSTDDSKDGDE